MELDETLNFVVIVAAALALAIVDGDVERELGAVRCRARLKQALGGDEVEDDASRIEEAADAPHERDRGSDERKVRVGLDPAGHRLRGDVARSYRARREGSMRERAEIPHSDKRCHLMKEENR